MHRLIWLFSLAVGLSCLVACGPSGKPADSAQTRPKIVTTFSLLGSLISDLVGDKAEVLTLIPNGQDPHDWEPSAKDLAELQRANLIVENGLGLEAGLTKALTQARTDGVKIFTALDHVTIRRVGAGQGIPSGDPDQALGAQDPHFWLDPLAVKAVILAVAADLQSNLNVDCATQAQKLSAKLDVVDATIRRQVQTVPSAKRRLVTGHESLGYFADRYGFRLVGAIVPSLDSQAQVSASHLAKLKQLINDNQVRVVFTELGTSPKVAEILAKEASAKAVELQTHSLSASGSYFDFLQSLADTIVSNLLP